MVNAHVLAAVLLGAPLATAQEPGAGVNRVSLNEDGAFEGYTLYTPLTSERTLLVDMAGEIVHEWASDLGPGNSVYLLDDGTLLRCGKPGGNPVFGGGGEGGRVRRLAPDGSVLWSLDYSDETRLQHHDIQPLPSGNILLIAWEQVSAEEAIAHGRDPEHVSEREGFWPDYVVELEPEGADGAVVVWEWHTWDHLIQDFDETKRGHGDVTAHPERVDINGDHRDTPPLSEAERLRLEELEAEMRALGYVDDDEDDEDGDRDRGDRRAPGDWMHTNGISYDPERDLISLSVRTFSEVWVIDHSTTTEEARGSEGGRHGRGGDLLWRWGNPRTYGAGTASDQQLFRQHECSFVPPGMPGAGNVIVFDNGEGRPGRERWSRAVEIEVPIGGEGAAPRGDGGAFGPAHPVWAHGEDAEPRFFSSFISGCQRLPNGNTLICIGTEGRVIEVTPGGELVWEFVNGIGGDARDEGGGGRRGPRPGGGLPPGGGPPPEGGPGPDGGPPAGRGGRGRGGRGGVPRTALFRATRLAADHPGIVALLAAAADDD